MNTFNQRALATAFNSSTNFLARAIVTIQISNRRALIRAQFSTLTSEGYMYIQRYCREIDIWRNIERTHSAAVVIDFFNADNLYAKARALYSDIRDQVLDSKTQEHKLDLQEDKAYAQFKRYESLGDAINAKRFQTRAQNLHKQINALAAVRFTKERRLSALADLMNALVDYQNALEEYAPHLHLNAQYAP